MQRKPTIQSAAPVALDDKTVCVQLTPDIEQKNIRLKQYVYRVLGGMHGEGEMTTRVDNVIFKVKNIPFKIHPQRDFNTAREESKEANIILFCLENPYHVEGAFASFQPRIDGKQYIVVTNNIVVKLEADALGLKFIDAPQLSDSEIMPFRNNCEDFLRKVSNPSSLKDIKCEFGNHVMEACPLPRVLANIVLEYVPPIEFAPLDIQNRQMLKKEFKNDPRPVFAFGLFRSYQDLHAKTGECFADERSTHYRRRTLKLLDKPIDLTDAQLDSAVAENNPDLYQKYIRKS